MASNDPPQLPANTRVNRETIEKAVNGLLKWNESKSSIQKPQLLEEDQFIYLILTLKKIPPMGATNPRKIPLPHALHVPPSSELCLIIDDRTRSNLTSDAAKKKVKSENIPISKVLKLSKLKSDYREFEKKRKLCNSYDMFLADKRLVPLLPRLLGKYFFKKKKIPVQVNLTNKNWKEQIEKICGSALLYLRTGTCSVLRVGRVSMEKDEIVDNVVAAVDGVAEIVPKKWANVRSFHVKFSDSLSLPVYQALPDTRLKIDGTESAERSKSNELKTERKAGGEEANEGKRNEKDKKSGKKDKLMKGRICEFRYMDDDDDDDGELLGGVELGVVDSEGDGGSDRVEDDKMGDNEFEGKKTKKGVMMTGGGFGKTSDVKKMKKLKKIKEGDGMKEKNKTKVRKLKDVEVEVKGKKLKKTQGDGMKEERTKVRKLKDVEMKVKGKKLKKTQTPK